MFLLFARCILLVVAPHAGQNSTAAEPKPAIIAYLFPEERIVKPEEIRAEQLTRINYAFANLKSGRVVAGFAHDAQNLQTLVSLRKLYPHLQILISVGGWSWSGSFSDMALTPESRSRFIDSALVFIQQHQLDGIDIDWEYPGQPGSGNKHRPEDKQNFTHLLSELHERLQTESKRLGRPLLLSIAAEASNDFVINSELQKIQQCLDSINLMTYDYYVPGVDRTTGHHAPLHTNPRDPKRVSAESAVTLFEQVGVPSAKIVLGVPFYGHAWSDVASIDHGLFQPGSKSGLEPDYTTIQQLLSQEAYRRFWDAIAQAPYLYSAQKQTFITYEDPESLRLKCQFTLRRALGGVMFWEYSQDDQGELLHTIFQTLHAGAAMQSERY